MGKERAPPLTGHARCGRWHRKVSTGAQHHVGPAREHQGQCREPEPDQPSSHALALHPPSNGAALARRQSMQGWADRSERMTASAAITANPPCVPPPRWTSTTPLPPCPEQRVQARRGVVRSTGPGWAHRLPSRGTGPSRTRPGTATQTAPGPATTGPPGRRRGPADEAGCGPAHTGPATGPDQARSTTMSNLPAFTTDGTCGCCTPRPNGQPLPRVRAGPVR